MHAYVRTTVMVATLAAGMTALPAQAAETVHINLTLDGTAILGDSTQVSLGRADTIECSLFRTSLRAVPNGAATVIQGGAVTCRKRVDRATPLLVSGLVSQQSAVMLARFFRPNPSGDGTTEQFYTVQGMGGRITAVKQLSPDVYNPASAFLPAFEEVTMEFTSLTFLYTPNGVAGVWP